MSERPLIFGEVLLDRFPEGAVLGGAPFNVAWHLRALGGSPLLISRVGDDGPGRRVLEAMRGWGLDAAGVQRDQAHPTGAVEVTRQEGGGHRFEILEEQAYDFIDVEAALDAASAARPALLYHGTLAARAERSRAALEALLARPGLDVFVDLNLREPFWREEALPRLLERARWCKVSDEELQVVARAMGLRPGSLEDQAEELAGLSGLELLIVTRGAEGAWARAAGGAFAAVVRPGDEVEVVDTVGAGDAFTAVTILGLLEGWPLEATLDRAQRFASAICGRRGATVDERDFYEAWQRSW